MTNTPTKGDYVLNDHGERVAVVLSRMFVIVDSVANDTLYGHKPH